MDLNSVGKKVTKRTKVVIDGKDYFLYYPIGAFAVLQRYFKEKYGKGLIEEGLAKMMEEQDLDAILYLLAVGVNFGGDKTMTKEFLGEVLEPDDFANVIQSLTQAIGMASPSPVEEKAMLEATGETKGKNEETVSPQ